MEKLINFLYLDGFGVYVWPAYLLAALILGGLTILSLRALKRAKARLQRHET